MGSAFKKSSECNSITFTEFATRGCDEYTKHKILYDTLGQIYEMHYLMVSMGHEVCMIISDG